MNRSARAAGLCVLAAATTAQGGEVRLRFDDVTRESGIDYVNVCGAAPAAKGWLTEGMGAGAAWLDYDGDGALDLYLVNGSSYDRGPGQGEPNRLYRGDGRGHFVDVTALAGVGHRGWGYGVTVGDYDNDGDPDLYVTNYGPNVLYRNNGDGTFSDVTEKAGVGHDKWSTSAVFFDPDADGDLDLYVDRYMECDVKKVPRRGQAPDGSVYCTYKGIDVFCGPLGQVPTQSVFYRNNGDGSFTDATRPAGLWLDPPRYALGVVTGDYDGDGDTDLFVANDGKPNLLWRNNGNGTFTDVALTTLCAFNGDGMAQAGMGTDFGDWNGDGWLDIVTTTFSHDLKTVFTSMGGKLFRDDSATIGLGVTMMTLSWGTGFYDFDLDGDLDLFIANGHVYPEVDGFPLGTTYRQANHLFINQGSRLVESSKSAGPGFAVVRSFRGAAFADYDNDGDMDLLVTAMDDKALLLNNRTTTDGHWLELSLVGKRSNRDGIGARVTVTAGGRKMIRERKAGGSYLSSSDPRVHIGLGAAARAELVEVRWPSGTRDVLRDVPANQAIKIVEGSRPAGGP